MFRRSLRFNLAPHLQFSDSAFGLVVGRSGSAMVLGSNNTLMAVLVSVSHAPEALGRPMLEIVVNTKHRRVGGQLTLDDLEVTEIGDWKMPAFKLACVYAV
jgi:hypothetical protein